MTANPSAVKPGLAVAIAATVIVAVAAAGCSKNTTGTGASSTTGSPVSAGAPAATSAASPSPSATASARFVGEWHVHGSTLNITPTTATLRATSGMGSCMQDPQAPCSETETLTVVSGNDTQLTLRVTAVSYNLHNGRKTSVNPTGPSTAVGDSIQLVWQAPGLLKATVLQGFPGMQGGNPYWCGAGISQSDKQHCGA
jgi:hypothetical protein